MVNDLIVNVINSPVEIPFLQQGAVVITIDENLQENNNITLNLLEINGQPDEDITNNSAFTSTGLDSDYDIVTLIINADDYPSETSWEIYDEGANQIVASGSLDSGDQELVEEICLNYNSCFSLYVYDSYGDGICCGYGEGDFLILDASGNTVVYNSGEFDYKAQEAFCLDETGCEFTSAINVSNATSVSANDGSIVINTSSGVSPFQYSIDGGQTFFDSNTFDNLAPGNYDTFVQGATGLCSTQESVLIEACVFTTVDITTTSASSVVSADGSIVISPTSGEGPYLYSIDAGQSFVTTNVFLSLPIGTYNVIVQDSSGVCLYEQSVPVRIKALIINEINYSSSDTFNAGDWIELYNPESTIKDVSNWKIKDDNDSHVFVIPEGTQIQGNGYLVFVKDESDFISVFPNIPYVGELGFGFGGI